MKTCFKCGTEKPLADFYPHPRMADGHLNKCKKCTKKDTADRYVNAREKVREYERQRFKDPSRKAKLLIYQKNRRKRHPEKEAARKATARAVKSGRIAKTPCVHCGGKKVQAHHRDYANPLDVAWVCFKCHREIEHGQKVG